MSRLAYRFELSSSLARRLTPAKGRICFPGRVQIRTMEPGDAAAVADIYNEGIRGRGATFQTAERAADDVARWVEQDARYPVVVGERNGAVVGWARASSYSEFPAYSGVGELGIYVAESARGGGVGRTLVDALADAARERGYWKLIAKVFPTNEGSIALLHRCGYRDVGVHLRHGQLDGEWRDVLLLEKSLS
jgi:phosphinothricin acetyltransferase